jgi:DNA mismatch endonuclease, patch repair protein
MSDNLSKEQRSFCMSRVKGRDTGLERAVRSALQKRGLRFRKNVGGMPGRPDIVFVGRKVAVFLDGDFWHGYRFGVWKGKIPAFWRKKIGETRMRDRRNFAKLRRMGWKVLRFWGHSIKSDIDGVVEKIVRTVEG